MKERMCLMFPFIHLGDTAIEMYHVMMVIGFSMAILTILWVNKRHHHYHLPVRELIFLIVYVVVGALLGARLLFVLTNLPKMIADPGIIVPMLLSGGLVFYGGVLGGIGFGAYYIIRYKLDPIKYVNLLILSLPLGHAFGRVGCFCAGCCHGKPTDSIFGVIFPFGESHPYHDVAIHPTQLYEAFFNLVLFIVLINIFFRYKQGHRPYLFVSLYLVFYGIFRFFNEFLRGDDIRGVFLLSTSQWISLVLIISGMVLLIRKTFPDKILFGNPKNVHT